jgi:hypothetical protein
MPLAHEPDKPVTGADRAREDNMSSDSTFESHKIYIDDLAEPVLSELQQQAVAYADANPVVFDPELILQEAKNRTGLTDFGPPDFRERLDQWAASADADTGLSNFGRMGIWSEMARLASTRLEVEDFLKRHPDALDVELESPIIVAGLPRSGTTHMLEVLAADRRLRELPYWEAIRPVADRYIVDGVDTRHALCSAGWEQYDALMPYVKMIHEFSPDHISEDVEPQCIDFGSYYLEWMCLAPAWRDYYFAHDHTPVYRYMAKVLKLMSYQRGPNRWVTKCPQHMEQLLTVNAALPGATTVITHRDPVASIQSALTGVSYSARVNRKTVDRKALADYWVDRYERILRACVRDRDALDADRSLDVYFHELTADPRNVVGQIYDKAGLEMDDQARKDLDAVLAAKPRGRHGQLVYNLRKDFGLEPSQIRERFGFYFDRFPDVRVEVK